MALAAKIQGLVQKAVGSNTQLGAIDDLSSTIDYVQVASGVYNPATDTMADVETEHADVRCALVGLSMEDLEWWPADVVGQKMLIPYLNLPIEPSDTDRAVIDGDRWSIFKIKSPPGNSIHIIYVRRP